MSTEGHSITVSGIKVAVVVRKSIKNLHLGVYAPGGCAADTPLQLP